jgi:hypothetical protein
MLRSLSIPVTACTGIFDRGCVDCGADLAGDRGIHQFNADHRRQREIAHAFSALALVLESTTSLLRIRLEILVSDAFDQSVVHAAPVKVGLKHRGR